MKQQNQILATQTQYIPIMKYAFMKNSVICSVVVYITKRRSGTLFHISVSRSHRGAQDFVSLAHTYMCDPLT